MGRWLADDLVSRCGLPSEKVHHVGGGINLEASLIDDTYKAGNKFLFVGRDFPRKNGPLVYQAFQLLLRQHPHWELHVAGPKSDPYPDDHSGQYHYHGDCSHEALSELFNRCDVFVMPSVFEAYGLVFIEALTYGLPCIGRDAYEMPHFIDEGHTGLLLREQTPQALAALMEEVLTTPAYAEQVRQHRSDYLRDYTWDAVVERIMRVMEH